MKAAGVPAVFGSEVFPSDVLETIAGAGHQVMLQQPELFAEAVLPFLLDASPGE